MWKLDDIAREKLTSCAEEAASKAAKEVLAQIANVAETREKRLADRLASDSDMKGRRMVERLDDVVKEISESMNGRMTNLEAKMQKQWEMFAKKWEDKIVQLEPGSKEGTITMAECRIQKNVQAEVERLWTERMEKEDKIMTNKNETLNLLVERLSQEIVNLNGENWKRSEHRGYFVWKRREHNQHRCSRYSECVLPDPSGIERLERREGKGWGLEAHPWNWDCDG